MTLEVLYDDVLEKQVGHLKRKDAKLSLPDGNKALLFKHINGCVVQLPTLVFPYRRAIAWVSECAYKVALESPRKHSCAFKSSPSAEGWRDIYAVVNAHSHDFSKSNKGIQYAGYTISQSPPNDHLAPIDALPDQYSSSSNYGHGSCSSSATNVAEAFESIELSRRQKKNRKKASRSALINK